MAKWGSVTITGNSGNYEQRYKRKGVTTHIECQDMVAAAVEHAKGQPGVAGTIIIKKNIAYKQNNEPGDTYMTI
jgi:hypothetical protein